MTHKNIFCLLPFLLIVTSSFSQLEIDSNKIKNLVDTLKLSTPDNVPVIIRTSNDNKSIKVDQSTIEYRKNQEPVKIYTVTQKNGEVLVGEILSDDGREILINTESIGKIYINKYQIKTIELISKPQEKDKIKVKERGDENQEIIKNENLDNSLDSTSNVFSNKYFINSNALPLKKAENYSTYYLLAFDMHFAVSKRLSLGITSSILACPIGITSKFILKQSNKNFVALQIGAASSTFLLKGKAFGGMFKAIYTRGDNLNNFSLAGGFEFISNFSNKTFVSIYEPSSAYTYIPAITFSIGGIKTIGKKTSFVFDSQITENKITKTLSSISGYTAEGNVVYKEEELLNSNILIFPGLRFQKSEDKAFQFNVGCNFNLNRNSKIMFPFPTLSWYRKF